MAFKKKTGTAGPDTLNGTNSLTTGDWLVGLGGNDKLNGKAGDDLLEGGGGKDKLDAGEGADTLLGGGGSDTLKPGDDHDADSIDGGNGMDTVDYSTTTDVSGVKAYLAVNDSGRGAAGDSYVNVENVKGSAFNDHLQNAGGGTAYGGGGIDHLYGGGGLNTTEDGGAIRGDAGNDTLHMEYGNTRAWLQNGQGADTIDRFVEGQDKLFVKLSDWGFGTDFTSSEIRNSNTVTATGTNAQFIFEGDAQNLWFDANGTAAGGLTLVATFTNGDFDDIATPVLGINDFEWIA